MFKFNDILRKNRYIEVKRYSTNDEINIKPNIPGGMWIKCNKCGKILYKEDVYKNYMICTNCNYNFRLNAKNRIKITCDEGTFKEINGNIISKNLISFPGYEEKLKKQMEKCKQNEAVVTGICNINGHKVAIGIMDSHFMMGSMGAVVGEKITLLVEKATEEKLPLIIFTASGGARMQEGMFSLMQMAKTSAAIKRHSNEGLLYIAVLTDPTTGGVTASFATQADIILAEPQALIGFAGKRVIQQTINEELPDNFQTAEFLLEKGFIDKIVERKNIKRVLDDILTIHGF